MAEYNELLIRACGLIVSLTTAVETLEQLKPNSEEYKETFAAAKEAYDSVKDWIHGVTNREFNDFNNLDELKRCITDVEDEVSYSMMMKHPNNIADMLMGETITLLRNMDNAKCVEHLKKFLEDFKTEYGEDSYNGLCAYYDQYEFWGKLHPEKKEYSNLEKRAELLVNHSNDLLYLYNRLEDFYSKQTLNALIQNFFCFNIQDIEEYRAAGSDYFDFDIFPDNRDDVFIDAGAYTGDTIRSYTDNYGFAYSKIYCYEISRDSIVQLTETVEKNRDFHDVIIRKNGVGDKKGVKYVAEHKTIESAHSLSDEGKTAIDVVTIDEDINEDVTFIKMDIEGGEYAALKGAAETIRRCRPKLAIAVYHGYEDIWRIPRLIDEIYDGYTFHLRHYGGNRVPSEYVLLCVPPKEDK